MQVRRTLLQTLLFVVLFVWIATHAGDQSRAESEVRSYPPAPLELDTGYVGNWVDWYGQWVVIAYYAVWCVPCYEEVKFLNELHAERDDRRIVILGVNFDGKQGEALQIDKSRLGIDYPDLLSDPSNRWHRSKPEVLPFIYLIDPSGNLHSTIEGIASKRSLLKAMR